jgi:hypothetical protein
MSTASLLRSVCDNDELVNESGNARSVYESLLQEPGDGYQRAHGEGYLKAQLQQVASMACDLPADMHDLGDWVDTHCAEVGEGYAAYLKQRREGAPRQYFTTRSAALHYLQAIAPTKFVDGAWLYGLTRHWPDGRFRPLITTYLEELGDGDPQQNHVTLYQNLLEKNGCSTLPSDDNLYVQGAIQLALGHHADKFLPEIIGYNLGYEQPPLHMLITAHELKELGIDPYYFTLHVTTDNASTGHARQAAESVQRIAPVAEKDAFYQRVRAGYLLNELGPDAASIMDSFDIHQQTVAMLENKRFYGSNMHSDYCRIEGKTVNEWLQTPGQIETFLKALTTRGWIKPNDDPAKSRFWQLIHAPKAPMAGVFSDAEAQLIYDWIAGDWLHSSEQASAVTRFRGRASAPAAPVQETHNAQDPDIDHLRKELKDLSQSQKMARLIESMSPAKHTSPAGVLATRMFSQLYRS